MSLVFPHRSRCHLVKYFYGPLDDCLVFIQDNKPLDDNHWFELYPAADVYHDPHGFYICDLYEMSN